MDFLDSPPRPLRARWVVTLDGPPLDGGSVTLRGDMVESVGRPGAGMLDIGDAILCPAPVNAHVHLEWSWLGGSAPRADRFTDWVRALLARPLPPADEIQRAARKAVRSLEAQGVRLIGNVSASLSDLPAARASSLAGVIFHELLALSGSRADEVFEAGVSRLAAAGLPPPSEQDRGDCEQNFRAGLSPHGPHTVSRSLLRRLAALGGPISIHAAESAEEGEFLRTGGGAFRTLHEERNGWDGSWSAPGTSAVRYLDELGLLGPRTLLVHAVHVDTDDIERLAASGTAVALCPRSNQWTGAGLAPLEKLLSAGLVCALATDSLASNADLDMAAELAAARALWPGVAPAILFEMATAAGAWALGLRDADEAPGIIAPGRAAHLCTVRIPPGASAAADPYRILCGDYGPVRFEALPPPTWD